MEVLPCVSPDHCCGAMEHLHVCGSWPLHVPALGFTGMVQPGLSITLWAGEGVLARPCWLCVYETKPHITHSSPQLLLLF